MKQILFAFFILISVVSTAKVGFYGGLYEMSALKVVRPGFALSAGITARNNNMYFTLGRTGTPWSNPTSGTYLYIIKVGLGYSRTIPLSNRFAFAPGLELCVVSGGYRNTDYYTDKSKNYRGYSVNPISFNPNIAFDYQLKGKFRLCTAIHSIVGNATSWYQTKGHETEFKATPYLQVGITYR